MAARRRIPSLAAAACSALVLAGLLPERASAACSLPLVLVPCIEATFPASPSSFGALDAGTTTTSSEQLITVSANQPWGIRVSGDVAGGRMREHNGTAYVTPAPRVLTNALKWGRSSLGGVPQTPVWTDLATAPAAVVTGQPATGCVLGGLCASTTVGVKYRQQTSFSDRRVAPNSYRVLVTYDAQLGF